MMNFDRYTYGSKVQGGRRHCLSPRAASVDLGHIRSLGARQFSWRGYLHFSRAVPTQARVVASRLGPLQHPDRCTTIITTTTTTTTIIAWALHPSPKPIHPCPDLVFDCRQFCRAFLIASTVQSINPGTRTASVRAHPLVFATF